MAKLDGITSSEKLTLLLDGELDPGQEEALMAEIDNSPELQEEMDQLLSIREALVKDTEAFTPPAAVTSSVFSAIGYMAPASAGGTAAGTAAVAPFVQSIVVPVITALLISGGTLIFTSNYTDSLFRVDDQSTELSNTPIEDQISDTDELSDDSIVDAQNANNQNNVEVDNYPITSTRNSASATSSPNQLSNLDSRVDDEREVDARRVSSRVSTDIDSEDSRNISSSMDVSLQNNSSNRDNLNKTDESDYRIPFNGIMIKPSGIVLASANTAFGKPYSIGRNGSDINVAQYDYSGIREIKNHVELYSVGAGSQFGIQAVFANVGRGFGIGANLNSIMAVKDANSGIESSELQFGAMVQYKSYDLAYEFSDDLIVMPVATSDINFGTNFSSLGLSAKAVMEYSNFTVGAGYRYNSVLMERGEFQISEDTPLPSGFVFSFGYQF
jgi:hypothetical protein